MGFDIIQQELDNLILSYNFDKRVTDGVCYNSSWLYQGMGV